MKTPVRLSVYALIGSQYCISTEDGQIIFDKIFPVLKDGRSVVLSFQNITTIISAFLNAAIGRLYNELTEEQIRSLLTFEDMDPADVELVDRVAENAKSYFANVGRHDQAWRLEIGDDDGDTEE